MVQGKLLIVMHGRSRRTIESQSIQCRDGARRVFTYQADIFASTKREAPLGVARVLETAF